MTFKKLGDVISALEEGATKQCLTSVAVSCIQAYRQASAARASALIAEEVGTGEASASTSAPTNPPAPPAPQPGPAHAAPPTTNNPPAAAAHHHLPANMARVFKLQFDARRIICCSQTSIIVGWDFANGDEKIIEASQFFAPIE
jgi:F-box and WD-40 domain protein 1/11